MLDDTNVDPAAAGQSTTNDPQPQGGQSEGTPSGTNDAPSNTPNNLKGKTSDDIVKMYGEAQSQIGKLSTELGDLRKFREQMNPVLEVIQEDRDIYDKLDNTLKKKAGVVVPDKPSGETVNTDNETRSVVESQIINQFIDRNGINTLDQETKGKVLSQVGKELINMYDLSGKATSSEVISKINLSTLDQKLQDALLLSKAKYGFKVDPAAEIGSISSGSLNTNSDKLSTDEAKVAKRMGVSEEDYIKNKKLLQVQE